MFDIGFAELVLIGVVGLLVIGPERLPEAIRTGSQWLRHFKRGFDSMKREIQQELEVGEVKKRLTEATEEFSTQSAQIKQDLEDKYHATLPGPEHDIPDDYQAETPTDQPPRGGTT